MERLLRYPWPGNVRELENAMERGAILARPTRSSRATCLPTSPRAWRSAPRRASNLLRPWPRPKRILIVQTLERSGWNHSRTAESLGIGRTTLWRKLKEYGIDR